MITANPRTAPLFLLNISGGHMDYVELLQTVHAITDLSYIDVSKIIRALRNEGLIEGLLVSSSSVRITESGVLRLKELQQEAKENARNKRHQRLNTKLAILNCVISLFSLLSGVIAEYQWGIVDFLLSLL